MQILFVIDPIHQLKPHKDSTVAMMRAAQKRGWALWITTIADLAVVEQGQATAACQKLQLTDRSDCWYQVLEPEQQALGEMDFVMMRKDPPFDMRYIFATYVLELAEAQGARVINRPSSLRDVNEKCSIARFPQCTAPTLISASYDQIKAFIHEQQDVIVKPLDGMGGASIFRLKVGDPNISVTLELMTEQQSQMIMAQRYIPEVTAGDKRILLINGEPIPFALARIPAEGETRANLAAGGRGVAVPLTDQDRWLCQQVSPFLKQNGLWFVGLDVIGAFITEINVTSPTCIQELDQLCGLDIAGQLFDALCIAEC